MMMTMMMITGWQNCHRKWMLTICDTPGFKKVTCVHLWHTAFFEGWSNAWDESIVLCEAHQRLCEVYAGGTQFHGVGPCWTHRRCGAECLYSVWWRFLGCYRLKSYFVMTEIPICVAKNNQRCLTISQIVSVQFPSFVGDFVLHQHFACGSSFISVCCDRNTFFLSDLVFRIPMLLLRVLYTFKTVFWLFSQSLLGQINLLIAMTRIYISQANYVYIYIYYHYMQ